jgi:hypothetical protein
MSRIRLALLALLIFSFTPLFAACESDGLLPPENKRLFVGPSRVDCVGEGPRKCLLVKERMEDAWQLFYDEIEGFTWEPGYIYEITVRVERIENPPADGPSLSYHLVQLVSRTEVVLGPF